MRRSIMMWKPVHAVMPAKLRRFTADQHGVSAIEFAILLPLMLTLYFGGVEVSQAVSADRKNTMVAHTIGDLVAQSQDIKTTEVANVMSAAQWIIYPFSSTNLKAWVSSVCIDPAGTTATIKWSKPLNATDLPRSGDVTTLIPPKLMIANASFIWGEATYNFRPTIGWTITGTLSLKDQFFLSPRQGGSVTLDGNATTKCP
jgi:Flp pilus assembly protein TadG